MSVGTFAESSKTDKKTPKKFIDNSLSGHSPSVMFSFEPAIKCPSSERDKFLLKFSLPLGRLRGLRESLSGHLISGSRKKYHRGDDRPRQEITNFCATRSSADSLIPRTNNCKKRSCQGKVFCLSIFWPDRPRSLFRFSLRDAALAEAWYA